MQTNEIRINGTLTLSSYYMPAFEQLFKKYNVVPAISVARDKRNNYHLVGAMAYPVQSFNIVRQACHEIYHQAIITDINDNGINKIILRELYNQECFITGDIISAYKILLHVYKNYVDITLELVNEVYHDEYIRIF